MFPTYFRPAASEDSRCYEARIASCSVDRTGLEDFDGMLVARDISRTLPTSRRHERTNVDWGIRPMIRATASARIRHAEPYSIYRT